MKILVGVICLAAILACYAIFVPSPRVALGVLSVTADNDSSDGCRQVGEVPGNAALSATASTLQATCNVSTFCSSSNTSGSRFFGRSLAIYSDDNDLLMERVGLGVFEMLRN